MIDARSQSAPAEAPPGAPARRRRRRRDRRGVALVMVLGAITVLTVFLTELQEETSTELSAALAERDALRAEYHARSAVNLSRLLIATEPMIRAAVTPIFLLMGMKGAPQIPVWNFSDMVLGPFNEQLGGSPGFLGGEAGIDLGAGKNLGLTGGGRFELKIIDEESKINVNLAASGNLNPAAQLRVAQQIIGLIGPPQYDPLFEGRDADNQFSDRATICGAIVDWADFDEALFPCDPSPNAGPSSGVEDNFYQTIGLDYRRKNAAYDSVQELRLVRGMGDDFWATFVDPDPGDPSKRTLTVWGKREATVNVNTANAQTLLAVICGAAPEAAMCVNVEQMSAFLMGVTMAKGFTQGAPLFGTPRDFLAAIEGKGLIGPLLAAIGVEPVLIKDKKTFLQSVSIESKFISIYADGVVPGNKREARVRIHAVVDFTGAQPPAEGSQEAIPTGGQSGATGLSGSAWEDLIKSNPAGNIIYYRID